MCRPESWHAVDTSYKRLNNRAMANDLLNNKLLIIKGILAEKCGLHPDLYDELSELIDDVRILSDAKDRALAKFSDEIAALPLQNVNGWLSINEVSQLDRGDIVRHKSGGNSYVIDATYGERATAVDTRDITNADEWLILACR